MHTEYIQQYIKKNNPRNELNDWERTEEIESECECKRQKELKVHTEKYFSFKQKKITLDTDTEMGCEYHLGIHLFC